MDYAHGHILRVGTDSEPPLVLLGPNRSGTGHGRFSGYLVDLLDSAAEALNFTYEVVRATDDPKFGMKGKHGNLTGLLGMFDRKGSGSSDNCEEIDIALSSFSVTSGRKRFLDFSAPVEHHSKRLLVRRDYKQKQIKWLAYSKAFRWQVWLAIVVAVAPGVCALWALSCKSHAGLLNRGSPPVSVVLLCFWMLAVTLNSCYTARLTSYLAVHVDHLPIRSLAEAAADKSWNILVTKGNSIISNAQDSGHDDLQKIAERMSRESSHVRSNQEGIDRVFTERSILFTGDFKSAYLVRGNCSYAWIPGSYYPTFRSIGFQKDLPYAAQISAHFEHLRATGQMKRMLQKWWGPSDSCEDTHEHEEFHELGLLETGSAFVGLLAMASFSVICVCIECLLHAMKDLAKEEILYLGDFKIRTVQVLNY